MKILTYVALLLTCLCVSCQIKPMKNSEKKIIYPKGTYGFDKQFLKNHFEIVELRNEASAVLLSPDLQGRVMTSSCNEDSGYSFGWLNHDYIQKGIQSDQFNPYGGEERFWLGPEGGQFSLYFKKDEKFEMENWKVPAVIDTKSFELIEKTESTAKFYKKFDLINYSGTLFQLEVNRSVKLLTSKLVEAYLGVACDQLHMVAYESANEVKNVGANHWNKEGGMLSIWMLGMYNPSDSVTIVIPTNKGDEATFGKIVNDNYFGEISSDRLKVKDNIVYFKGDGKSRSKIGISPKRAYQFMGSYDSKNKSLTILECSLPKGETEFVNSAWEHQENPFNGDALNSYNDGPLQDGGQMGPFYELETSSPALKLKSQESYIHVQRTYHFQGELSELNNVTLKLFGISLDNIKEVMQ